jgi:hypothetical protein
MRVPRLAPAVAAATLLTLAPACAFAAQAGGHQSKARSSASCSVSIQVEEPLISAGETVTVSGTLRCPSGFRAGQTVMVFQHSARMGGVKVLGTTTTGPAGAYSISSDPLLTDTSFYVITAGARSATKLVRVAPVVTFEGPPETATLRTGAHNSVTFAGKVNPTGGVPSDAGAEAVLERENATSNEEWFIIQRTFVRSGDFYLLQHTFGLQGAADLRVVVRPHGVYGVRGISQTRSYVISQSQNPRLEIFSTADQISFGQSIMIHGTVAGATSGTPVMLQAHTNGGTFAPIATGVTVGNEYQFTQMPLVNTEYRVISGAVNSTVLVEGVHYLVTANPSVSTVAVDQALTFSGTVTPVVTPGNASHAGKPIYLERENAFGGGFHVIDVALLQPNGTYSITHAFFGRGTAKVRVHVPGDPENLGVSSPVFTITVTPPPPGPLPVPPPTELPRE